MNVSDKELNGLLGFYAGLRQVIFVAGIVVLVAAVLAVVGGAFIAGQHHTPGVAEKKTGNQQPEDKPQPEKRVAPVRHRRVAPPEPVQEPEAEPEPENIPPAPVAAAPISKPEPVTAPAPAVVFVATVGEKHYRAHHKGRGGCDGDLFLTDTQLHFECPGLPGRGLTFERTFERNAVSAHDDGIRDIASGLKYHFKVTGLDKQGARVLFNQWVRYGMASELAAR